MWQHNLCNSNNSYNSFSEFNDFGALAKEFEVFVWRAKRACSRLRMAACVQRLSYKIAKATQGALMRPTLPVRVEGLGAT